MFQVPFKLLLVLNLSGPLGLSFKWRSLLVMSFEPLWFWKLHVPKPLMVGHLKIGGPKNMFPPSGGGS